MFNLYTFNIKKNILLYNKLLYTDNERIFPNKYDLRKSLVNRLSC